MPKRYFEMDSDSPEESWRRIRMLRAVPPAPMPDSRRTLFASSLEQAQQQFEASARIGFESRALNLYYGLSQAGRALSSIRTAMASGKSPKVSGHGLKIIDLRAVRVETLFDTRIRGEGRNDTSFRRLAELLDSDALAEPVTLGAIWHMLPEVSLDHPVGAHPGPLWAERPHSDGTSPVDPRAFSVYATSDERRTAERRRAVGESVPRPSFGNAQTFRRWRVFDP
ncbi:YaaC family protein [Georgenia yuyongxinii]|uniref:Uncharacterized protein n=1 Tax=Georgenia yuyongxinii TaxID=2589797 RepID=A0A552WRF4_9MICO|nr:hypothetical protein [Georgenia yuyongxinii]TRW45304.1 hypothetical protein FJ693_09990 [Georgenia yuyongxinii]